MLVSRRAHDALIAAKDQTIARLQDEVCWLRRMIQPERGSKAPLIEEADLVIGGHQEQIVTGSADPNEEARRAAIESEAAQLLSGRY